MSDEVLVEFVLNYGDWQAFKDLIKTMGVEKTAAIFKQNSKKKRSNYHPEIVNYYQLFFKHYASGDSR